MSGFCSKALTLISTPNILKSTSSRLIPSIHSFGGVTINQIRGRKPKTPVNVVQMRYPLWYLKKENTLHNENLTQENKEFVKEIVHDKFGPPAIISGISTYQINSPLKNAPLSKGDWKPKTRRTGLIGRKIGIYPMWDKNGKIIWTTLVQIVDNHVVKYTPPEEYVPTPSPKLKYRENNRYGCLLVGAESVDPQCYTKEYSGLFAKAGLMPKRVLGRFFISPEAAIQPGTPLLAAHYSPGDVVDVVGSTKYRGFQGVMKRHGFKGMPASHGVTKTHRRGGNTGGGGEKGRVWPGTKKPGHMGNRLRRCRGLVVWRVNTKYNVLYLQGLGIPGETNKIVYIYDTLLPLRKLKEAPKNFPTYAPEDSEEQLPENLYHENVHQFTEPTITFTPQK
uniref:Large ribosomal subunit protein uL3m n=2 Tax=Clastoptera arizonana TaxID=38151 RepID=A0A1B6D6R8_9HEMI